MSITDDVKIKLHVSKDFKGKNPTLREMLYKMLKEILWQSGGLGLILVLLSFVSYQSIYSYLQTNLGKYGTDPIIFSIFVNSSHSLSYILINGFFALCDMKGYLQKYKLDRKPYMIVKQEFITKCLLEASFSQLILNPFVAYYLYFAFKHFGMMDMNSVLPDLYSIFNTFVIAHLFNGIGFYFAHRLFHTKLLYATFHKQHHEFKGTIGIAAEFANPVEQIIANQLPTLGGVLFFKTHPLCVLVWMFIRTQQTYEAHSGYCFKECLWDYIGLSHWDQAIHHDYHHTVNIGNYGTEWMDYFLNTQESYINDGGNIGYLEKKTKEN